MEEARVGDGRTVVLHVDLDCFYAAVEHVRLGIPTEKPLAVQQWEGLIAVNYSARAAGIIRHDRVREALKKCPELQLVHVETVGSAEESDGNAPNRESSKVSLERYRQASVQVFSIFRRFASVCERASIDEAYMDVTSEVDEMLKHDKDLTYELQKLTVSSESSKPTMVVECGPCNLEDSFEKRLLAGAVIASNIRAATREELGYTCSVGIAPNKLLAKIASARNKPDRQTIVLPRAVENLMADLPLKKIKLLGGKLGEELRNRWNCTTAGEAQSIPLSSLLSCFGERMGAYAWRAVRGAQNDKVQVKQLPKSMLAAKSFTATSDTAELRRWLGILSEELSLRVLRDLWLNHRQPRILQLYYREGYRNSADHSKSCSMPHAVLHLLSSIKCPSAETQSSEELVSFDEETEDEQRTVDWPPQETVKSLAGIILEASFHLFQLVDRKSSSFSRLAISASGFQKLQSEGTHSLQRFFTSVKNTNCAAEAGTPPPPLKPQGIIKFLASPAADNSKTQVESPVQDVSTKSGKPQGIMKYLAHPAGDSDENLEQQQRRRTDSGGDLLDKRPSGTRGIMTFMSSLEPATDSSAGLCDSSAGLCGDSAGLAENLQEQQQGSHAEASELEEGDQIEAEVDLKTVDVAEQRRILQSFETSRRSKASAAAAAAEIRLKKRNQTESGTRSISTFFKKSNKG